MTCMTETYDNILMWSHYANSHKGICIEYDVKKLLTQKNAFNYYIYPVIYGKVRLKDYGYDINKLIYDMEELENCIKNNAEYDGNYNLDDLLPLFLIKMNVGLMKKNGGSFILESRCMILIKKLSIASIYHSLVFPECILDIE